MRTRRGYGSALSYVCSVDAPHGRYLRVFILCSRGPLKGAAGCRRQRRVCTFEFCFLIIPVLAIVLY